MPMPPRKQTPCQAPTQANAMPSPHASNRHANAHTRALTPRSCRPHATTPSPCFHGLSFQPAPAHHGSGLSAATGAGAELAAAQPARGNRIRSSERQARGRASPVFSRPVPRPHCSLLLLRVSPVSFQCLFRASTLYHYYLTSAIIHPIYIHKCT